MKQSKIDKMTVEQKITRLRHLLLAATNANEDLTEVTHHTGGAVSIRIQAANVKPKNVYNQRITIYLPEIAVKSFLDGILLVTNKRKGISRKEILRMLSEFLFFVQKGE